MRFVSRCGLCAPSVAEIRSSFRRRVACDAGRALFGGPARTFPALTRGNLPPMRGRLEILRDAQRRARTSTPTTSATSTPRSAALQAADRFFFLDVLRHLGAGRVSALIGDLNAPKGLGARSAAGGSAIIDRFVRPLGFEAQSRADATRLTPRAAGLLDAFAEGVNAALRAMRGAIRPSTCWSARCAPGNPPTVCSPARACAFVVSLTGARQRAHLRRRARRARRRRRAPPLSGGAVGRRADELSGRAAASRDAGGAARHRRRRQQQLGGERGAQRQRRTARRQRSARAVHSARRPSGITCICDCPDYRVQGGMFPGCPAFGFGHNGALAWGCTTGFRDGSTLSHPSPARRSGALPHRARQRRDHQAPRGAAGALRPHGRRSSGRACEHGILYPDWRHHDGVAAGGARGAERSRAPTSRAISRWRSRRRSRSTAPRWR